MASSRLSAAVLVVLAVVTSGCVRSDVAPMGPTFPPRPDGDPIAAHLPAIAPAILINAATAASGTRPELLTLHGNTNEEKGRNLAEQLRGQFVPVGRIDVFGAPAASWEAMVSEAENKARGLGATDILIADWGTSVSGYSTEYGYTSVQRSKQMSVMALRRRST